MGTHFAFAPRFDNENDDYSIIMVKALADRLAEVRVSHVADPGRNGTLFHWVFRSHYRVQSAVAQNFHKGWGSYVVSKHIKYS